MLNYILFLSMVHEYAYFFVNIFVNRSIRGLVGFEQGLKLGLGKYCRIGTARCATSAE